jgi:simple sugar transport system substrate-binding protein
MSAVAPEAHLASNVVDWGPYYKKTVTALLDGTWKGGQRTIWGKPEGANDVIKINAVVPEPIRKKAEEAMAGIKGGTLDPFTGPIVDSTGKERLAKGTAVTQEWKDKVDFYVKGVEGKIPAGK